MLCPECATPAPGGTLCPRCGTEVPEKETFSGQGARYLAVFFGLSCLLLIIFLVASWLTQGVGLRDYLRDTGRMWPYALVIALPTLVGLYYWVLLREEEVTITDDYISRRSHWGDEYLAWSDVRRFEHRTIPLGQTRLGSVTWFSRFFPTASANGVHHNLPGSTYDLIGPEEGNGNHVVMRLEPGTLDDFPWLVRIIEERIGPAVEP